MICFRYEEVAALLPYRNKHVLDSRFKNTNEKACFTNMFFDSKFLSKFKTGGIFWITISANFFFSGASALRSLLGM